MTANPTKVNPSTPRPKGRGLVRPNGSIQVIDLIYDLIYVDKLFSFH